MDDLAPSRVSPVAAAAITRARLGVGLLFFVNGAAFASWVSRIPALRTGMGLSDGALGSVLFAMSCGVLLSFPLAGKGAQLMGARQLALVAGVVLLLLLPMPFLIGIVPSLVLVLVMLVVGAAIATMQVAMNVLAVDVQARMPRPVMSSLHGAWSAGGLAGAGLGSLAAHAAIRPLVHLVGIAATLAGVLLVAWLLLARANLPARASAGTAGPSMSFPRRGARRDRAMLGLGVICFCAFLTEGALADWSAVWLHDKASASEARAALGYAAFAGAMTAMRMVGDRLLALFGSVRLLRLFTALGAAALAGALVLARVDTAMIALVLLGLGMATVVPTAFAAAGRRADALARGAAGEASSARAVALLSGFGYSGLLMGPPLIGWLAQATSLTWALSLLVLLVGVIVALVPLLGERVPRPDSAVPA